jgi:porin
MGAPGDRNLVDFGMNAGIVVRAPLPGRDDDTLGVGYGLAKVSSRAGRLDQDVAFYRQRPNPVRSSESFLELTYQIQLAGWWNLQPDLQYVFTPSGGIPNPSDSTRRIGNEAIFGLRTNVIF